jgi:hypothetical protein
MAAPRLKVVATGPGSFHNWEVVIMADSGVADGRLSGNRNIQGSSTDIISELHQHSEGRQLLLSYLVLSTAQMPAPRAIQ